jgi:hypothetical protein
MEQLTVPNFKGHDFKQTSSSRFHCANCGLIATVGGHLIEFSDEEGGSFVDRDTPTDMWPVLTCR